MPRCDGFERSARWTVVDEAIYAYLLGCYLGDGHLNHRPPHTWTLRVSCDPQYPEIKAEIARAMTTTFPGTAARSFRPSGAMVDVLSVTHPAVGRAFPQHGAGRKHLRPIALEAWQARITTAHPESLLRGLIHSDGCRCVNRFRTVLPSGVEREYAYPRYFFSNLSAGIRQIFADHCELIGVRVTQSNPRNLTVSHRVSVAILDRYVGPKS